MLSQEIKDWAELISQLVIPLLAWGSWELRGIKLHLAKLNGRMTAVEVESSSHRVEDHREFDLIHSEIRDMRWKGEPK